MPCEKPPGRGSTHCFPRLGYNADMNPIPPTKRIWFQFSLRTLLALVLVFGCGFGWLGMKLKQASEQRMIVERIARLLGYVTYDYQYDSSGTSSIQGAEPPGPKWLRKLLGDDFMFTKVHLVHVRYGQVSDADLKAIGKLRQLHHLGLIDIQITDAQLEHLRGLTQLQGLSLSSTKVTDAGLQNLRGLTELRGLDLDGAKVTDAGLEHLQGLRQLKRLDLDYTQVTDEGVKKLQQALPNCLISHRVK